MKKNSMLCFITVLLLWTMPVLNAQFRTYQNPTIDRNVMGGPADEDPELVDKYGKPKCCAGKGEDFNFTLSFGSFNVLLDLEGAIAAAQRAKVDKWLKKQEATFLKEINRQMGKSFKSFSTAQHEYFKFYDGGPHGLGGPVARAHKLSAQNNGYADNWNEKSKEKLKDFLVLDSWVSCGYCSEYRSEALKINSLGNYDSDNGPGVKFYGKLFRDGAKQDFGNAYYKVGLNKTRAVGLSELAKSGEILNKISEMRVVHYRRLGLKEKIFQMSAYLIGHNRSCSGPVISCLPYDLWQYQPPPMWEDRTLIEWSKKHSAKIPFNNYVFSEDYLQGQLTLLTTGSYGVLSKEAALKVIDDKRNEIFLELIEDGIWHTACRSFEYQDLGNTGTKVAAVKGIEHPVARGGRCPGIGYVFPQQTYYFTLPIWKPRAKRESVIALEKAFARLEKWFKDRPCTTAAQPNVNVLATKLREFIKLEFGKIGGAASIYPPGGWNGEVEEYETNVGLSSPDC